MEKKVCNFCGSEKYEEKYIDYLYRYKKDYLLVPETPVEICLNCGMIYYDAKVLNSIEQHFFAIQDKLEEPDYLIEIPAMAYSAL